MPESVPTIANSNDTVKDSSVNGWVRFPRNVLFDERLSHGARLTYAVLVAFCFSDKKSVISHQTIGRVLRFTGKSGFRRVKGTSGDRLRSIEAEYSRQSVAPWLEELIASGHIERISGRKGTRNSYRLIERPTSISGHTGLAIDGAERTSMKGHTGVYEGPYRSSMKGHTLTKFHSRRLIRNVETTTMRKAFEASDELLELHQRVTGWSFPIVAQDLAKALAVVGKANEALLIAHYKHALTQPSIEKPMAWAMSQVKKAS
jgi:hypothetical protein